MLEQSKPPGRRKCFLLFKLKIITLRRFLSHSFFVFQNVEQETEMDVIVLKVRNA